MTTQVTATFVDGVFKPDQELSLAKQARVKLTIEPLADQWTSEKGRAAWETMQKLIKEHPLHFGGERLSREELYDRG